MDRRIIELLTNWPLDYTGVRGRTTAQLFRDKPCCKGRPRPRCGRTDSPRNMTCYCSNYHFPHRTGSGRCQFHPDGAQRMAEYVYGGKP